MPADGDDDASATASSGRQLVVYDDFDMFDDAADVTSSAPTKRRRGKRKTAAKREQHPATPMPEDMPSDMRKYWAQRYRLFSKFDQGIQMDTGQCSHINAMYRACVEL